MKYRVVHEGRRRRAGRYEPLDLGEVNASSAEDALRLAKEQWPGIVALTVYAPPILVGCWLRTKDGRVGQVIATIPGIAPVRRLRWPDGRVEDVPTDVCHVADPLAPS